MKRYSANVWETLIESLHLYWQVIKERYPLLLAIFVPIQLVVAFCRYFVESSGAEDLANIRFENLVATALGLTFGLVAVALVIDRVFLKCTGQRRSSGGGIAAAWGRMMATGWLCMIVEVVLAVVVVVALAFVVMSASTASLSQLSCPAGIAICIIMAPLVAVIVWIVVHWSFAIVLSAIYPAMGSTALGASWRFVRGRAVVCILMLVAARFVMVGISAIPASLATWYAKGEMIGLPVLPGTVLTRTVVMSFGDLFASFGSLFMSVALTTFWVRTVEPYDLPESLRRSRARLWVVVLLLLGGFSYVFAGCFGVKTAFIAKEEIAQRRSAESADMIKALENVQRESAEGGRVENEQAGRTEE